MSLTTIILHRELLSSIQQAYPYVKSHTRLRAILNTTDQGCGKRLQKSTARRKCTEFYAV